MKWVLVLVLLVVFLIPTPVMAVDPDSDSVTVTAVPYFGGEVTDFTAVIITDTQVDLSWSIDELVTPKVMVRAKYGSMPEDRTEGYLVYEGQDESVIDTSMDFDESPGMLFYRIWAQDSEGVWIDNVVNAQELEAPVLTLIGLILLAAVLMFFGTKLHYLPLALASSLAWAGLGVWILMGENTNLQIGDVWTQVLGFGLVLMIFVPLGLYLMRLGKTPIRTTDSRTGQSYEMWGKPEKYTESRSAKVKREHKDRIKAAVRRARSR